MPTWLGGCGVRVHHIPTSTKISAYRTPPANFFCQPSAIQPRGSPTKPTFLAQPLSNTRSPRLRSHTMAAVYKSLSKTDSKKKEAPSNGVKKNRQRVLILSSRGVTYRHRHLLSDLSMMIPHGRRESKWDSKNNLTALNEAAEIYNCNVRGPSHVWGRWEMANCSHRMCYSLKRARERTFTSGLARSPTAQLSRCTSRTVRDLAAPGDSQID